MNMIYKMMEIHKLNHIQKIDDIQKINEIQKMMEIQKELMPISMKMMKLSMRPIVFTGIPFILTFRWFMDYFTVIGNPKFFGLRLNSNAALASAATGSSLNINVFFTDT